MDVMWIIYALIALLLVEAIVLLVLPKAKGIRVTRKVATSPHALFSLVSDLGMAPRWYPTCISAEKTAGREGPARKQKLLLKHGDTVQAVEQQVTTWVDDRQYGWKTLPDEGPIQEDRTVFTFTAHSDGTEVEVLGEATARSLFSKLFVSLGYPSQRRAEYTAMLDSLEKISPKS